MAEYKAIEDTIQNIVVNCTKYETPLVRRKRRRSAWEGSVCAVCGDHASGYHYNVLSCEGCKGFYRRVVTEDNRVLICKFGGNCEMDLYWRRKCPACRLKKCNNVGMRPEFVTCKERPTKQRKAKPKTENGSPSRKIKSEPAAEFSNRHFELERISQIVKREYSLLCATTSPSSLETLMSVADITTCHVQALVEFCKAMPGFVELSSQDQITMIKNSTIDASLLRSAYSYSQYPDKQLKQTNRVSTLLPNQDLFKPVRRFYDRIAELNPTGTQIGLLVAMSVFASDRGVLLDPKKVESIQMDLVETLQYECEKEAQSKKFPKLVLKLTDLRYLNHEFSSLLTKESSQHLLTPLLRELWDVDLN